MAAQEIWSNTNSIKVGGAAEISDATVEKAGKCITARSKLLIGCSFPLI